MSATIITVVGNLVDDPEVRRLPSGIDVTNFRVASSARRFDRNADEWVDSSSLYLRVTCWRALATNVAASLHRGDPVVLTGRLQSRSYVQGDQQRTAQEMEATAVGPDLARGIAQFRRIKGSAAGTAGPEPDDQAGSPADFDRTPDETGAPDRVAAVA